MTHGGTLAPKVLLLTHGDPNAQGIGELFLREIACHYPPGRLWRYSLVDTPTLDSTGTWLSFPSVTRGVRFSAAPILSSYRQRVFWRFSSGAIVADIERLVKKNGIETVWIVLNSGYTICLAERLMERLPIPFVFTVWDSPENFAKNQHLDVLTKRSMLRAYSSVLRKGFRVAVASEGMRDLYRGRYGIEAGVMIHGIHPSLWRKPSSPSRAKREYTIGFAGSLYCKREWNALVACLRKAERRDGPKVRIRFIGRFPRLGVRKEPFVELMGVRPFREALTALSETDVAYVPYWFDRRHAWMARTAFPNKLSACAAAGTPVLFHGPRASSPGDFLAKYPMGLCCHSLDADDIWNTLQSLLLDSDVRATAAAAQQRALEEELGLEVMLQRFAILLGIDRSLLLPLVPD